MIEQKILEVHTVIAKEITAKEAKGLSVEPGSDFANFCRTRSLTAMRQRMTEMSDIRLCLGGNSGKPDRRRPGLLEEAILTIQAGKPLYLASAIGGVSRVIADAILRRRIPDSEQSHLATPQPARAVMEKYNAEFPVPVEEGPCTINPNEPGVWNALEYLRTRDVARLAEIAHLSSDEYNSLLTTADINRALTMFTLGATRILQARNGNGGGSAAVAGG